MEERKRLIDDFLLKKRYIVEEIVKKIGEIPDKPLQATINNFKEHPTHDALFVLQGKGKHIDCYIREEKDGRVLYFASQEFSCSHYNVSTDILYTKPFTELSHTNITQIISTKFAPIEYLYGTGAFRCMFSCEDAQRITKAIASRLEKLGYTVSVNYCMCLTELDFFVTFD